MMSVKLHVNVPMGIQVNGVRELGVRDFLVPLAARKSVSEGS